MKKTVRIDAFPDSPFRNLERDAIVCVDVLGATTALVTASASGRRVLPAATVRDAYTMADGTPDAVLAADFQGALPEGFEAQLSLAALEDSPDSDQPLIFFAPPGTQLVVNSAAVPTVYLACLRNISSTIRALVSRHSQVALLAAGASGAQRCEDEMAIARIARGLGRAGFELEGLGTDEFVNRWAEVDISLIGWGKSADELRRAGRSDDLAFTLTHDDDLEDVFLYRDGEVVALSPRDLEEQLSWFHRDGASPDVKLQRPFLGRPDHAPAPEV